MEEDKIMSLEEWTDFYLKRISELKRLTAIERNILELSNEKDKTKIQESVLDRLLNNEYRKYKIDEENKIQQRKADERSREILQRLRTPKKSARKKRNHELISIGALTEVVGFEKDRGLVAGALAYILEQSKHNPNLLDQLKSKGDKILHDREMKRKAEREERRKARESEAVNQHNQHNQHNQ